MFKKRKHRRAIFTLRCFHFTHCGQSVLPRGEFHTLQELSPYCIMPPMRQRIVQERHTIIARSVRCGGILMQIVSFEKPLVHLDATVKINLT